MEDLFIAVSESLFAEVSGEEQLVLNFYGEDSLFIRFNKSKVRQVTDVFQIELVLALKSHGKETSITMPLTNNIENDLSQCKTCLKTLRNRLMSLAPLPFFVEAENLGISRTVHDGNLPTAEEYLQLITTASASVDLAGLLISGKLAIGNSNSLGQRHWFESTSFCFDYSLYTKKEKAVKSSYSGINFEETAFVGNLEAAKENLKYMSKPNKILKPGKYRCYFAPSAVGDLLSLFNRGGVSQSALKRGNSPLLPLESEGLTLSDKFSLKEDFSLGLHQTFNEEGETTDDEITIFEQGVLQNLLTSTRTAIEFNLVSNYSNDEESLRSPVLQTGDLKQEDILADLGTGLYISNLHYLNWSDTKKGRMTGMTRFACFYVENGEIVAPIKDLRFDETIYNAWGGNLLAVTDFTDTLVNSSTYYRRSPGGSQCPGMLIEDFNFTL